MTLAQFRAAFPAFTAVSNDSVNAAIAEARLFIGERWEEFTDLGLGSYAAHKLIWDTVINGEPIGLLDDLFITSKTVGRTSYSVAAELLKLQFDDSFYTTKPGRRYLELRRLVGRGAVCGGSE
jgi:hypothetical protein